MTEAEVFKLTQKIYKNKPEWARLGQWAFICLREINSDIANKMCGTTVDPFYDDEVVDKMLEYLLNKQ